MIPPLRRLVARLLQRLLRSPRIKLAGQRLLARTPRLRGLVLRLLHGAPLFEKPAPPNAFDARGERQQRLMEALQCRRQTLAQQAAEAGPGDMAAPEDMARHGHHKPTLAFVSPLPPEATGIADYSAELLPNLAEHYSITLVVAQPSVEPALAQRFPVIQAEAFRAEASRFDRVLYQVGNSPFHAFQFPLLRDIPGSVVLHDIYLFDAVWWMQESGQWPDGLRQRLFVDHGYPGVLALEQGAQEEPAQGGARGPEHYPVNGFVTDEAAGLIVHSRFARELDRRWRPQAWHEEVAVIPHLRELPTLPSPEQRRALRQRLGIDDTTCLVASFGGINPKKLSDRLVEAVLAGQGETFTHLHLVLVGAQHAGDFGHRLEARLRKHSQGRRVTVTGYVSRDDYLAWLQAADIAVQLREHSRGESSGAVLDAMAHGLPVVVNAHGSSAELPRDSVVMLEEAVSIEALNHALAELATSRERCNRLGEAARAYVARDLEPRMVASQYRQTLEAQALHSRRQCHQAWLAERAASVAIAQADDAALEALARELVADDPFAPAGAPRILFDVSTIAWHDLKTGIERVTRRLAEHLLRHPPAGWRVELIRWGGDDFHLARGFAAEQLGIAPPAPDRPCEARAGDVYVSVEWAPPLLEQAGEALAAMRARGVRCYFTVHDLLPLRLPECFPDDTPARMRAWFEGIAGLADGITTVSASVAEDVRRELAALELATPPWVRHFHLGADFSPGAATATLSNDECRRLQAVEAAEGPLLLMVGTLEPRKGHDQVLAALERCWADDAAFTLCIVGKQGWNVDDLATRLRRHPQRGARLHWVEGASDALLEALYARASGLVAASWGEGFGLPLIEAAQHGVPLLARDIPVFREVAGPHASYFHADDPAALARSLLAWRERWQAGALPDPRAVPWQSWAQSAEQWLGHLLADLPVPPASLQPLPNQPLPDTPPEARP